MLFRSGDGLIKKHGFDPEKHAAYIKKIIGRFKNPYLQDDVSRVGREPLRKLSPTDRLISPLTTAAGYGLPVDHLLVAVGAADRKSTRLNSSHLGEYLVCRLLLEKKSFFNDTATTEIYTLSYRRSSDLFRDSKNSFC